MLKAAAPKVTFLPFPGHYLCCDNLIFAAQSLLFPKQNVTLLQTCPKRHLELKLYLPYLVPGPAQHKGLFCLRNTESFFFFTKDLIKYNLALNLLCR